MTPLRFRRNRRTFALIPVAALAALLSWQAIAYACVPAAGSTTVNRTSAEPGDTVMIGGSNLPPPHQTAFRVKFARSQANCHHEFVVLGGNALSDAFGNIAPVARVIPTNTTSGVRWMCWHRASDDGNSVAVSITII